ncbi:urea ABC transporter ATP-binding protein UrtD [Azospirillum halopraeferens]|uniref:urea ABC transporter ATP-binding protein UrtD n=1 Tax=Azospirillum halopraeferens TaxID=34010 RepID=UPI0009FF3677|nr:urea ABC transporter ATP-binding protein UrtD [Azospirillum halopraeferens]
MWRRSTVPEGDGTIVAAEPKASAVPARAGRRTAAAPAAAAGTVLYLDGVTVSFDGFRALNNLSLVIAKGELRTIIGPNGAGKTTMMDVITGKTKPDRGHVIFDADTDLTRLDETRIANLGIGRKFQKPTVFEHLTVFENLELALKCDRGTFRTLFFTLDAARARRIDEIMGLIGLGDRRAFRAGQLSHGQKQWLEIGMLLMQEPQILLLDEPVAGMTDHETEQTADLILDINRDRSVVVVEHDMEFVRRLGAKVTVLHEGSVLAEGSLETVKNDHRVIEVYLGR